MSLGVLNNIAAIYAQNNLNQTQNSLQNVLQQLSSGSRINSGADDAAGLALADGLHANEAALNQSSQNASSGVGLLQTADGALSQVTNLLNRAVTLATEAANGTLNSSQIGSANQEYQNILTEIGDIGSTTNFNGNSVFSSTAKTVFVSDGTASGATTYSETIGALTANSVGTTAATSTALANPSTAGTTTALTNPTPTTPTAGVGASATFSLGASSDTVSGTLSVAVGGGTAVTETLAAGTTIANAVTQMNADAAFSGAGLVASQGTGANANQLIITGPTGATNTLSLTGTSLSGTTVGGPVTGSGSFALAAASDSVSGTLSVAVNGGTAVTATLATGTSLAAAVTQLNADTSFTGAGLTASVGTGANANKLIITGGATDTLDMSGSTLSDTGSAGPGVSFAGTASSLTAANATTVLTSITSAIQDIDYQRGNIGASINELNAASNVASAESVNLTSAEDSVRSTNYGQATSDMAKYQVLSQTGISALAQANSVQQEILKLLQ